MISPRPDKRQTDGRTDGQTYQLIILLVFTIQDLIEPGTDKPSYGALTDFLKTFLNAFNTFEQRSAITALFDLI